MRRTRCFMCTMVLIMLVVFVACSNSTTLVDTDMYSDRSIGKIYLYGEHHGVEKILKRELELWGKYYHDEDMRHLFVELPYYSAELLNLWMQSDNDYILAELFEDWKGTALYKTPVKEFYKKIKNECPETIFHGTDVGHQHHSTGQRFLEYLEKNNLKNTEEYLLAQETIEQGEYFYKHSDHTYRENKMVENFIREFDKLKNENIMGIYGGAHTNFDAMESMTQSVPCMANQLKEHYGNDIYSEDLTWIMTEIEPLRVDVVTVNEKDYKASYFGKQDLTGLKDYSYWEFWRLENAYDYFKHNKKTGYVLPYDNYPMLIEAGQVFVIDYTKTDGSVERKYYRSDGYVWDGLPSTENFTME
ncbi:hypothetical protein RBU61_13460 [Tissierella sp. MB52-C2]|uniref:hypothetical protein n=1 Tax=Tissierella sp. MB52-C2 TaxID=3070999 RepID=UPI00280AA177|nr:hypothetical protein [Tissierella sp. MB52-C2]WMM23925.1 hypothetical protein RBU61_13460 [Tissierella sp. MB52-C2]